MTTVATLSLALATLCVGLFGGLMFSLVVLLQPKWDRQSAAEYVADIQPFLEAGKGNRAVALTLFAGLLAPVPTLLGAATAEPLIFVLVLLGLAVFGLGALGVTVALNLPMYTALMGLDARSPSEDWKDLRRRFYRLNLTRFVASLTAFALFVAALAL